MSEETLHLVGGISWDKWLSEVGRKKGPNGERPRIKTVNIDGKKYVRAEAIKEFWDRAEAGEFAKVAVVPKRSKD